MNRENLQSHTRAHALQSCFVGGTSRCKCNELATPKKCPDSKQPPVTIRALERARDIP
jgi:hypothetical protein